MEPTNAGRIGPAAPIAAAGAAAASADHPARRAPDGEMFTTPGSSPRHAFVRTPWHPPQAPLGLGVTAAQVLGSCQADRGDSHSLLG